MEWFDYVVLVVICVIIAVPRFLFLKRRRQKHPADQSQYHSDSYKQATKPVAALRTIVDEIRGSRKTQQADSREKQLNDNLTFALLVIAATIGYLQWRTLEKTDYTYRILQRAWLAPRAIGIPDDLRNRKETDVELPLIFENIGREPATEVNEQVFATTIFRQDFDKTEAVKKVIADAMGGNKCRDFRPKEEGRTVFPGSPVSRSVTLERIPAMRVNILLDYALITGCLVYKTVGETHRSEFCMIAERPRSGVWRTVNCPVHNRAD